MSAFGFSARDLSIVLCILAMALCHAPHLFAQRPAASFRWSIGRGAERCVSEGELVRAVEARLGRDAFADDAQLVIEGRIEARDAGGFRAEIVLRNGDSVVGRRMLETPRTRCRTIDDSLTVMIALLVEVGREEVHMQLPPSELEVEELESLPSEPLVEEEVSSGDPSPTAFVPTVAMALGALGTIDVVPGPSVLFHWAFELGWAPFSLRLEGAYGPESSTAIGDGRAVRFSLGWGGISGCLDWAVLDILRIGGCAGVRGGAILGNGVGFHTDGHGTMPWAAITVAVRARLLTLGPVGFESSLGLDVPLFRDRFVVQRGSEPAKPVHEPPVVAPYLGISIVVLAE
jgi:hypothetical protein